MLGKNLSGFDAASQGDNKSKHARQWLLLGYPSQLPSVSLSCETRSSGRIALHQIQAASPCLSYDLSHAWRACEGRSHGMCLLHTFWNTVCKCGRTKPKRKAGANELKYFLLRIRPCGLTQAPEERFLLIWMTLNHKPYKVGGIPNLWECQLDLILI